MRLSSIQAETRPLVVNFSGETINCVWYPGKYNPDTERKARLAAQPQVDEDGEEIPGSSGNMMAELILPCLQSWDITDDKDVVLPLTTETMSIVPFQVLFAIVSAMSADINPQKKSAKTSGAFGRK